MGATSDSSFKGSRSRFRAGDPSRSAIVLILKDLPGRTIGARLRVPLRCNSAATSVVEEHVEWRGVQEQWNCDQGRAHVVANQQVDIDRSVGQGGSGLWVPKAAPLSAITVVDICRLWVRKMLVVSTRRGSGPL